MAGGAKPFLTAHWQTLVMLNYKVDPRILEPYVPWGTELDAFEGEHHVSVVGFRFLNTRVCGLPIPGHIDFNEVNLRMYVRRRKEDESRRGVVFIKEIVPRRAIAWVARRGYNENYVAMRMRHAVQTPTNGGGFARYGWHQGGRWHDLEATFGGRPVEPTESSAERFITEHYWGYTRQRDGSTKEYRVEHPPWRVWPATSSRLDIDATRVYGEAFGDLLTRPPASAFIAEGSAVSVYRGGVIRA